MDHEILEIFLDFAITSLHGKVGAADIFYEIKDYDMKNNRLILVTNY